MKLNFLGLVTATIFVVVSLSPSLLPRHWGFQAVVSGFAAALTYGIGTLISHAWRTFDVWEPSAGLKRYAWTVLYVAGPLSVAGTWIWGVERQRHLHDVMGLATPSWWGYAVGLFLALILAAFLVLVARGIRLLARRVAKVLGRWLPRQVAGVLGGVVVGLLLIGLLDGFVIDRFFEAADETFRVSDRVIPDDAEPTFDPRRSGSPNSFVAWEDLGSKGRTFVTEGPSVAELEDFSGLSAMPPIRAYAGLASHETLEGRAELVLDELDRTGAFSRAVLGVVTATGTGWVDPEAAAALEYIWNGDTALASMQYSYLPSWISFLVDSVRAREAGAELFNLVYERWSALPEDDRPLLVVFGESLGADGAESAFSGLADMQNRTDGVLLVGPPNFSELWTDFTADRLATSPERHPVYQDGAAVRFASSPSDLRHIEGEWGHPRILYLQYPSDPVVWWTPRLILRRPDWLIEPRGDDVLPQVRWFPLVTFLQLTADLANSIEVPPGHGHNYAGLLADGWAAVASPDGWSPGDTSRLRALLISEALQRGITPSN